MKRFEWRDVLSEELLKSIIVAGGIPSDADTTQLRDLLVRLLEIMGGPPFTDENYTDEAWDRIALGLLDDALREAFIEDIRSFESTGTILEKRKSGPVEYEIELGELVSVNWCTEGDLEALPEIGSKLARKIVEERRSNGGFKSGKDLADRVSGVGKDTVTKLLWRLRFSRRPGLVPSPENIFDLITWLVGKTQASPEEGLRCILEHAVSRLNGVRRERWYGSRCHQQDLPIIADNCSWVGILEGVEYYNWLATAIDEAKERIDMAMFHVAMPFESHPTRLLIDKLIAAKNRGVAVRILLDRDREEDPYKSSVINENALNALVQGGVDARSDAEDQLLHSKFLVIDADTLVIGTHNWSSGSYFVYDDVSLVINSMALAKELGQRFEKIWTAPA